MSLTGKYAYGTPRTNSPRLSRWATLAFTPPLVVGLSLSLSAVVMSDGHRVRAILSILPAQLFIFPFAFAYCVLPATLLWGLLENRAIRNLIATSRTAFTLCGVIFGLLVAPPTLDWIFSLPMKSTGPSWYLLHLITGPLAGALSAWLVFPKYNEPTP